ncbi:Uracil phosphoribosyltransferase [Botrimarina hoheduenensis]|uniref:Uracil phosphoribosyltransferase n=1 Tax=Botrimarina hoheduenensis TaxID=2528000 RepID=A0A5C5VW15_9BACT|nr:Uracil phosphoribosyltransferase [Botrimarina hoheduenensis]
MAGVYEVQHPLIDCHLSRLREATTRPEEFRSLVRRVATLLAYEATKDLAVEATRVTTPLTETAGCKLAERIGLVPILRAGLGMVEPVLDLIPSAEVWHLGLYRDEATAEPVEYYSKLPPGRPVDTALVVDPMLATGGSVMAAVETLYAWGVQRIKVLSVLAAQQGIDDFAARFPDVQIFVCRIDPELNANKFIVPGLGDAGDRIFNTPQR